MKLQELYEEYDKLSYEDKKEFIISKYGFYLGNELNAKFILMSLIGRIANAGKSKGLTVKSILEKIYPKDKVMVENVALLTEAMCYGCDDIDPCDCSTGKEAISKIKELLEKWRPF